MSTNPSPSGSLSDAPPLWARNAHLHTIVASTLRRVPMPPLRTTWVDTPDGDRLAVDWFPPPDAKGAPAGPRALALLSHGLEGSSRRTYILGMARALRDAGISVAAWNGRGCGASPGLALRPHHAGAVEDLERVLEHVAGHGPWDAVLHVGFSLGGNLGLLAAARWGASPPVPLAGVAAVSAPCDLAACVDALSQGFNRVYTEHFLRTLRAKMREKAARFPGALDPALLAGLRSLRAFDEHFVAPLAGFAGAADYYARCSSATRLAELRQPALIFNALDDPFLAGGAYPVELAAAAPLVRLEMPIHGGHVGFLDRRGGSVAERRVAAWVREVVGGG